MIQLELPFDEPKEQRIVDPGTEALKWARRYNLSMWEAEVIAAAIERDLETDKGDAEPDKLIIVKVGNLVEL